MLAGCSFIPFCGRSLSGNLKAYILTWIEVSAAFPWKETIVPNPHIYSQNHSELLMDTKSTVKIPDFYNSKQGKDEFNLEISVPDL